MTNEKTNKPKRKPGYYRVLKNGQWRLAEFCPDLKDSEYSDVWYQFGSRLAIGDHYWNEIDETPINPEPEQREPEQWISVKDRLPKNDDLVIITNIEDSDNLWVCCGYYRRTNRKWYNQFEGPRFDADIYPTHWRPLPKPPQS